MLACNKIYYDNGESATFSDNDYRFTLELLGQFFAYKLSHFVRCQGLNRNGRIKGCCSMKVYLVASTFVFKIL